MSETGIQTAILHAVQTVPGVVVFDPPPAIRRITKPAPREMYRFQLREVLRRLEQHEAGAILWRNNTGGAMLPGRGNKPRPVYFGLPGMPDILGLLRPSGRLFGREVKTAERRTKKDGTPGAFVSQPREEQRTWGEIFEACGGAWAVWRSAEEATEDMRRLMNEERAMRNAA